jgi:hypothetical protein
MDHRNLRRRLRRLAHAANDRFPYMNHGGCCIFAAAVATALVRYGVRHEVITIGDAEVDLHELRPANNTVNDWNCMGVCFGHMGVRLKLKGQWFTYDSERPLLPGKRRFGKRYFGDTYPAAKGGLTAAEATELASQDEWNPEFWSERNVAGVRALVQEFLP